MQTGHTACDSRGQDVTLHWSLMPHSRAQTGILHITKSVPPSGTNRDLCWNTRASYQQCCSSSLGTRWREPEESKKKGSQHTPVLSQLVYSVYRRERMRVEIQLPSNERLLLQRKNGNEIFCDHTEDK